ncbi:hypothetical protein GCM10020000_82660 [Streptomyces olivoverticillatus]
MVPSLLAAASVRPSGLNATERTKSAGPVRVATGMRVGESVTSHSRTVWSQLPVARRRPSGRKATVDTTSSWPNRGSSRRSCNRAPALASLMARSWPFGLNATV